MITATWLRKTELFNTLEESQINRVFSYSTTASFPEKKTIFHQGSEARSLYILIEGAITLTVKTGEKIDSMTSTLDREGAVFGMPCLLEPFRYNVTSVCAKPSKVLVIDADPLRRLMEEDPSIGKEVMKKLALTYFNRLNEMRNGISKLFELNKFKTPWNHHHNGEPFPRFCPGPAIDDADKTLCWMPHPPTKEEHISLSRKG